MSGCSGNCNQGRTCDCGPALASVRDAEPKGWQLVPVELTAENGAKSALMGEFNFQFGDHTPNVPWTTIKEIHRAVVKLFASSHPAVQLRADGVVGIDWSMVRSILMQGAAIQQDYQAGKFATYEHYSARMDAAARERIDELSASPAAAKEFPKPSSRIGKDPCGECHLQPGERCDICGAVADIDPRNCV